MRRQEKRSCHSREHHWEAHRRGRARRISCSAEEEGAAGGVGVTALS